MTNEEQLTELNALFSYLERCRMAAETFTEHVIAMTTEERLRDQEIWAGLVASGWQVELVDMLAETNPSGQKMTV